MLTINDTWQEFLAAVPLLKAGISPRSLMMLKSIFMAGAASSLRLMRQGFEYGERPSECFQRLVTEALDFADELDNFNDLLIELQRREKVH